MTRIKQKSKIDHKLANSLLKSIKLMAEILDELDVPKKLELLNTLYDMVRNLLDYTFATDNISLGYKILGKLNLRLRMMGHERER